MDTKLELDEVELNEILVIVQDKLNELRGRAIMEDHDHQMAVEGLAELEWKILKMLEG